MHVLKQTKILQTLEKDFDALPNVFLRNLFLNYKLPFYLQGRLILKNGRVYTGLFCNDHIAKFPDLDRELMNDPDLCADSALSSQFRGSSSAGRECAPVPGKLVNLCFPWYPLIKIHLMGQKAEVSREQLPL